MARTTAIAIKKYWQQAWNSKIQRTQLIVGVAVFTAIAFLLPSFFNLIQKREGTVLNDWLLAAIPPHNVSVPIFVIIWGTGLFAMWRSIQKPRIFITYVWGFIFITIVRVITISLIPLNPPVGLIILTDPLTGVFYGQSTITKDLFFSGHTSTLFLMFLCLERRNDKIIALIATIAVMCLLLVQHVHYTIDIITAPFVVYALYRLVKYLLN